MKKLNTYYVKGQFDHIKDLGRCLATSLYDLLDTEGINYFEYDINELDDLNQELEDGYAIWISDYEIIKEEE